MLPARRALVSVSDKTGLEDLTRGLDRLGIEIVSTGGTLAFLRDRGLPAVAVAEVTGFPEILDGRVKTLHPRIHGGILASRSVAAHAEQLAEHGIERIDLVVVNLYPFRETAAAPDTAFAQVIEQIDIGGPAMVRAAAKNFGGVAVVVDPADYPRVLAALEEGEGVVSEPLRRRLAVKAFRHTQSYDAAIAEWLARHEGTAPGDGEATAKTNPPAPRAGASPSPPPAAGPGPGGSEKPAFPAALSLQLTREMELRYGENPHQPAAVYAVAGSAGGGQASGRAGGPEGEGEGLGRGAGWFRVEGGGALGGFRQLGGKELSWNNLLDADAARKMAALFAEPAVVIVKHNNPCGVGRGGDLVEAYARALATDPDSAFGSVVALNRPADGRLAEALAGLFVEVLIAPDFDAEARRRFGEKKNLRLVQCPPYRPASGEIELRAIAGGFLAQPPDALADDPAGWTVATRRQPSDGERRALDFAWRVVRYVKSNAIVIASGDQTVGIGAGQMSRVDSCRLAIGKARLPVAGSAAASDAFFPFRDGLDVLAEAGVTAVVQPGGSKRDDEVVAAAAEHGMTMIITGIRHFRH
ncbi:MAG TPA: bifunctional phosphoribosylaminoimidazolecarboxamide formyltransferase/inosine monophosphate cyclohydrolase [Thermoanaerobaculia bacterium]|nr:bifunctional phosphoribosylaminoimidazolecarboxamide formyltransferase/inosine monophosphate cyclohydrolase [Thermoanaerobaculia bacterium]